MEFIATHRTSSVSIVNSNGMLPQSIGGYCKYTMIPPTLRQGSDIPSSRLDELDWHAKAFTLQIGW